MVVEFNLKVLMIDHVTSLIDAFFDLCCKTAFQYLAIAPFLSHLKCYHVQIYCYLEHFVELRILLCFLICL